jgi:hypothetical protein
VEKFEVLRVEDCNFSPSKENSKLFLTVRGNQYFEPFVENEIVLNIEFPNETSATVYSQRTGKASIILYFRDVELSSLYEVIRSSIKDSDNPYISLENVITPAAFRNKGIGTYLFSIWLQYVAQICIIQGMFPKEICGNYMRNLMGIRLKTCLLYIFTKTN